jgi:hypothetical protein
MKDEPRRKKEEVAVFCLDSSLILHPSSFS